MTAEISVFKFCSRKNTHPFAACKMAEPRAETCVCDLMLIMRARLLCGLYSRRAVPPRWRGLAKAYCLTLFIGCLIYIYFVHKFWDAISLLHWVPMYGQYFLSLIVSLWTGDENVYKFFTRNRMTDITLDSPTVFHCLQKQIKRAYFIALALLFVNTVCGVAIFYKNGLFFFITVFIPSIIIGDIFIAHVSIKKKLVMALFNCRMLILRRRLERYGFRTIGRAPPQPYCQIYDAIWQGLEAVNCSVKLLLFFDLIFCCGEITGVFVFCTFVQWQELKGIQLITPIYINIASLFLRMTNYFGHVALLESAAMHCEAMAVFTATQLIKNPSAEERRRMYELLGALEQRGARYRVLRALPLDARLVLQVIGFCSAQAIVLVNILVSTSTTPGNYP